MGHIISRTVSHTFVVFNVTRFTRGDARSFFCTYKMYLYAQNYFLKNIFKYCFKGYINMQIATQLIMMYNL